MPIQLLAKVRLNGCDRGSVVYEPQAGRCNQTFYAELLMMPIDFRMPEQIVRQSIKTCRIEIDLHKASGRQELTWHAAPLKQQVRIGIRLRQSYSEMPEDFAPSQAMFCKGRMLSCSPIHYRNPNDRCLHPRPCRLS